MRYAVDGYGVLSCVIGGMIDRMRTSVMRESISRWAARQDWIKIGSWSLPWMFPLFATYSSRSTRGRVTRSETWECCARSKALSSAMMLDRRCAGCRHAGLSGGLHVVLLLHSGCSRRRGLRDPRFRRAVVHAGREGACLCGGAREQRGAEEVGRGRAGHPQRQVPVSDEGRCTIYAARPQSCRNYHATNAAGCRQSYEEPKTWTSTRILRRRVSGGRRARRGCQHCVERCGLRRGCVRIQLRPRCRSFGTGARARFESKLKPFADLSGEEGPPEFDDLGS